ncbi:MAG: hypothetical protein JNL90_18410 [Planctomycetes bacterium]|nr:hypothetical protein [Planctomycetota bacterium]
MDVTGDGQLDVVAGSTDADPEGATFVWAGGSGLAGTVDPTARLEPSAGTFQGFAYALLNNDGGNALPLQFADVDLDGITDVLGLRVMAKVAGKGEAGAIYVWKGGPALSGTLTETALLQRGTPRTGDRIGVATAGFQLVDVTGDGAPDVIAASHLTTTSVAAAGSIEVWAARTGLAGAIASASLEVANPVAGDWLGWEDADAPDTTVLMHDVTGDGIRDVIGVASQATISGRADAGAIYVWAGGAALAAAGTLAPTATLHEATTVNGRGFGSPIDNFGGAAVRFLDWNGDGVDDLLSFGSVKQSGGSSYNDGHLLVFAGGASLVGTAPILAKLRSNERNDGFARPFWIAEVTGDGTVDVVASALSHDTPRGADLGSLLVFAGGPASVGTPAATSTLFDAALSGGIGAGSIDSLFECDLDGDGVLELVASWSHADDNERAQVIRRPVVPGLVPLVPISVPLDGYSMFGD